MNKDLLLQIAERIEAEPDRFNLNYFTTGGVYSAEDFELQCGTAACVAGWAAVLTGCEWESIDDIEDQAEQALDLTPTQARHLFYAVGGSVWDRYADEYGWEQRPEFHSIYEWERGGGLSNWDQITAYQAADVLKRIAKGDIEL